MNSIVREYRNGVLVSSDTIIEDPPFIASQASGLDKRFKNIILKADGSVSGDVAT
jgi:hypothetical protein